jgi:hypothetical protein
MLRGAKTQKNERGTQNEQKKKSRIYHGRNNESASSAGRMLDGTKDNGY